MTAPTMQRQQDDLLHATERQRLLGIAPDFIGGHQRPVTELPMILDAIDGFLRPEPSAGEILAGLRRLARGDNNGQ